MDKSVSDFAKLFRAADQISNWDEVAFKTIMITNLNIPPTVNRKTSNGKASKQVRHILDVKQEVCGMIGPGVLKPTRNCSVTLTHRDMGHLANMMEEYQNKDFKRFDRSFTKWLRRHREGGVGMDYDHWYHRFWHCGKSRVGRIYRLHIELTDRIDDSASHVGVNFLILFLLIRTKRGGKD